MFIWLHKHSGIFVAACGVQPPDQGWDTSPFHCEWVCLFHCLSHWITRKFPIKLLNGSFRFTAKSCPRYRNFPYYSHLKNFNVISVIPGRYSNVQSLNEKLCLQDEAAKCGVALSAGIFFSFEEDWAWCRQVPWPLPVSVGWSWDRALPDPGHLGHSSGSWEPPENATPLTQLKTTGSPAITKHLQVGLLLPLLILVI